MENIVEFPDKSVIEDEASRWIAKFEGDEAPTKQEIEELKTWMSRSPAHREILLQFASRWNDMDLLSELVIPQGQTRKPQDSGIMRLIFWLLSPVMLLTTATARLGQFIVLSRRRFAAVSTLSVLAVCLSAWVMFYQQNAADNLYTTAIGEQSTHTLKDGTVLRLNTSSKVEVIYATEKRRIILHNGEAYFDVSPDPQRPFEVYTGTRIVRAVGTAFSVYLNHDNVQVTVTEGTVDIAAIKPNNVDVSSADDGGMRSASGETRELTTKATYVWDSLMAGQSVVIPAGYNGAIDEIINHEPQQELVRRLAWREGLLVFTGESLEEVIEEVSRYTPMTIEVLDPEIKSMRIGGQFHVGEVDALFDVLENGFGIKVSRLSEQYVQIHARK